METRPRRATPPAIRFAGFVPERALIDAYGNGGFRFAGMSHRGSLLVLADGMHAWTLDALPDAAGEGAEEADLAAADLTAPLLAVLARLEEPQFLLVGTGRRQVFPQPAVRAAFLERRIGLDVMDTGAACRTYNILLAEQRPVMAALIRTDRGDPAK